MADDRPWYREPETFIAIAALIVSVSAVAVGIYEAALQRRHDRAEVWPHVEIGTYSSLHGVALKVENNGIGPAVVKYAVATVDGTPRRNWDDVVRALIGRTVGLTSNETIMERGIRAGDNVTMLALPADSIPPKFWDWITRASMTICYASVFDEYWIVSNDHFGGSDHWRQVSRCPPQPKNTDF